MMAGLISIDNNPAPLSERFTMIEEDPADQDYTDGKSDTAAVALNRPSDGTINYIFRFCDQPNCIGSANATGEPVLKNQLTIN